jgi:TonB family protein
VYRKLLVASLTSLLPACSSLAVPTEQYGIVDDREVSFMNEADALRRMTDMVAAKKSPCGAPLRLLHVELPPYPQAARARGIQGEVSLELAINEQGDVENVRLLESPHGYLSYVGVEAVRNWKFAPIVCNGVPVKSSIVVPFSFRLEADAAPGLPVGDRSRD